MWRHGLVNRKECEWISYMANKPTAERGLTGCRS